MSISPRSKPYKLNIKMTRPKNMKHMFQTAPRSMSRIRQVRYVSTSFLVDFVGVSIISTLLTTNTEHKGTTKHFILAATWTKKRTPSETMIIIFFKQKHDAHTHTSLIHHWLQFPESSLPLHYKVYENKSCGLQPLLFQIICQHPAETKPRFCLSIFSTYLLTSVRTKSLEKNDDAKSCCGPNGYRRFAGKRYM